MVPKFDDYVVDNMIRTKKLPENDIELKRSKGECLRMSKSILSFLNSKAEHFRTSNDIQYIHGSHGPLKNVH